MRRVARTRPKIPVLSNASVEASGVWVMMGGPSQRPCLKESSRGHVEEGSRGAYIGYVRACDQSVGNGLLGLWKAHLELRARSVVDDREPRYY